jgi:tetratricopeptide (TPR) repeat protein
MGGETMFLESKVTEIAIGQIRGFVKPSKAERFAAFELFVELSVRVTTPSIDDNRGLMRDELDNLAAIGDVTREILRKHGCEAAKGRNDGNIALAVVALRVYNEIILPRLIMWEPQFRDYEAERAAADPPQQQYEWESNWDILELVTEDLAGMRREVRSYMDTLAAIAGTPSLTDLVVPIPPSAPIDPVAAPPISDVAKDLGKPRPKMVRWFSPWEALGTLRANRGRHPDRPGVRDRPGRPPNCSPICIEEGPDGETWVDYVSDLGDGFDPTMAVAFQLTRPALTLPIDRSGELPEPPGRLPRGRLLVMGGDQVYPHSSAEGYRRQTILPYRMAAEAQRYGTPPTVEHNDLVAIPGNHDWYGGPEHFEDVFVNADDFAGHYRLQQSERWWAVQLPKGWWMWGIDTALDNTLNADQVAYFQQAAALLADGDRVIICSPVPLWQLRQKRPEEYFALRAFLRTEILQRGARTPLFLSGDSHFFAHYWRVDGVTDEHHITAGGGGAFMQPTHNLPEQVPYETGTPEFKLDARWPRPVESRSLGANLGSVKDAQFRSLFAIIAIVHALFAALITVRLGALDKVSLPVDAAGSATRWVVAAWPGWLILALLLIAMTVATAPNSRESQLAKGSKKYGLLHGAMQAALFVAVAAFARLVGPDAWWWRFVVVPLLGGVLSTVLFVMAVRWINRSIKANDTLAFSSAHLTRYKHFVRMRINADGDLDAYVIGIDPVGTGWYEAIENGELVPPYDERAGTPKLHYVWGRSFAKASEIEAVQHFRTLGLLHPETLAAFAGFGRRQFALHLKERDDTVLDEAINFLQQAAEGAREALGENDPTTLSYAWSWAEARIAKGGDDAASARTDLNQIALAMLHNDIEALASSPPDARMSMPLRPTTMASLIKAAEQMLLVNQSRNAQEFLTTVSSTFEDTPGLRGSVDEARILTALTLAHLREGDVQSARATIERSIAVLIVQLGEDHEYTLEAAARQVQVRVAELDDPHSVLGIRPPQPADRIAELTEILQQLDSLPQTHTSIIDLRMALARAHMDDGYPAGAISWLNINDTALQGATTPEQILARLTNTKRLRDVCEATNDHLYLRSVHTQIAQDAETMFGLYEARSEHMRVADYLSVFDGTEAIEYLRERLERADSRWWVADYKVKLASLLTAANQPAEALALLDDVRREGGAVVNDYREVKVSALNALGRPDEALVFLRSEFSRIRDSQDSTWEVVPVMLEVAEQSYLCGAVGLVELLGSKLQTLTEMRGLDDYLLMKLTLFVADEMVRVGKATQAVEMLERCLTVASDPAARCGQLEDIELDLVNAARLAGDTARALAVATAALTRENLVLGGTDHQLLCSVVAELTPTGTTAAVDAARAHVASRDCPYPWDPALLSARAGLAFALEDAHDLPDPTAMALAEWESILAAAAESPTPDRSRIYMARARVASLSGQRQDYLRAIALLQANLEADDCPEAREPHRRVDCRRLLAVMYFYAERLDEAVAAIDIAVEEAAAAFARPDPVRTQVEAAAEQIHEAASRGSWEPTVVAPDA